MKNLISIFTTYVLLSSKQTISKIDWPVYIYLYFFWFIQAFFSFSTIINS